MTTYFIEAADVLFFKDGREIAPGSEYSAASIFPPNPGTLYGALRSCLLALAGNADFTKNNFGGIDESTAKLVGTMAKTGELKIEDFRLARKNGEKFEALFPLPKDVLKRKKPDKGEDEDAIFSELQEMKSAGIHSNLPMTGMHTSWFVHQEGAFFEHESLFITGNQFNNYLLKKLGDKKDKKSVKYTAIGKSPEGEKLNQEYFCKEPRMGIVIDNSTNTVEEGKLFTTPFIRPNMEEGIGFLVDINVDPGVLPDKTKIRLGGDGKIAILSIADKEEDGITKGLIEKMDKAKRFKVVLTTPAIFDNGWLPDGIDTKTGEGQINGVGVKLVGACIGKHQTIGGWDVANNRPKSTKRAVPAGSVYYFELKDNAEKVVSRLHGTSICIQEDYQKQGLGIIYTGVV